MDSSTGPLTAVPAATQRKRGRPPKHKRNADTQLPPQPDAEQNANPVCISLGPGGEPANPPATKRGPVRPRRSPNARSELAVAPPGPSAPETITASTGPAVSSRGRGRLKKNAASPQAAGAARRSVVQPKKMKSRKTRSRSRINRAYNSSSGTPRRRIQRRAVVGSRAGPSHVARGQGSPTHTGGGGGSPTIVDEVQEFIELHNRARLRAAELCLNLDVSLELLRYIVSRLLETEFLREFLKTPDDQLILLLPE